VACETQENSGCEWVDSLEVMRDEEQHTVLRETLKHLADGGDDIGRAELA
jgi:hypothetical protein